MPRHYKKKIGGRTYRNFTEDDLQRALTAIRGGMSQAKASARFKISRGTLQNKLKGEHTRPPGHPTVFTPAEEQLLKNTLVTVSNWGFPFNKSDIRELIHKYLQKKGREVKEFKDNVPGHDYLEHFILRNNLSVRLAANIKRTRAAVGPNQIVEFFDNVKDTLQDVDPCLVFNYDETNVQDDPGAKKVIVPRGTKRVERVQQHSKASVSIMVCGNAAGDLLPPMVVYKAGNLYEGWTKGGPPGTVYSNTPSGWFDMDQFEKWFFEILLPKIKELENPGKKIVIGDNLASHFSPTVIEACEENNIYMTAFPPNSTHLMQPLDVAVFAPFKKKWREILDKWRSETKSSSSIPKEYFPTLLNRLWVALSQNVSNNLKSGFRATGLCPFNPQEVLKRIPDVQTEADDENAQAAILNESLIDLLQDLRGTNNVKVTRTRGKKIEPGKQLKVDTFKSKLQEPSSEQTPTDEPVAGPSGTQKLNFNSNDDASDDEDTDDEPLATLVPASTKLPIRKQAKRVVKSTSDVCAVCYRKWKNYNGPDWICCCECKKWICGFCNEASTDPFYTCSLCTNEDFNSDDSAKDVDFSL